MYENLKQYHCASCMMTTGHTVVRESRMRFCAICGTEAKLKPDEILPPPHVPKPVPCPAVVSGNTLVKIKTEGKHMAKPKLTVENIEEVKKRRAAGEKVKDLAKEYGVNRSVIYALPRGLNPKRVGAPGKGKEADQAEAGGGFKHALARMVAEAVDARLAGLGLDDLDAKIEAALLRFVK